MFSDLAYSFLVYVAFAAAVVSMASRRGQSDFPKFQSGRGTPRLHFLDFVFIIFILLLTLHCDFSPQIPTIVDFYTYHSVRKMRNVMFWRYLNGPYILLYISGRNGVYVGVGIRKQVVFHV